MHSSHSTSQHKAVHTVLLCSSIPLPQLHEKLPEIQLATGKLQGTEMYKTTVFFFILKCQKLKQKLGFIFDSLWKDHMKMNYHHCKQLQPPFFFFSLFFTRFAQGTAVISVYLEAQSLWVRRALHPVWLWWGPLQAPPLFLQNRSSARAGDPGKTRACSRVDQCGLAPEVTATLSDSQISTMNLPRLSM